MTHQRFFSSAIEKAYLLGPVFDPAALEARMHGEARLWVALGRMEGLAFDKKATRFNDIVETAFRYGRLSDAFDLRAAWEGLAEAVLSCSPDIPELYSEDGPIGLCPEWMLTAPDPRASAADL